MRCGISLESMVVVVVVVVKRLNIKVPEDEFFWCALSLVSHPTRPNPPIQTRERAKTQKMMGG
jgi:hypothetical protein